MSAILPRERLVSTLDALDDEEIENVLEYIELLQAYKLPADYDPANDPMLNGELWFSGDPDLATRSTEILRAEFGLPRHADEQTE